MDRMPTSDPPRLFDGRYELLGRLGTGGMATVWLAEDTSLHRKVAIKVLAERYAEDEQFVERFRREAQSAAGLNHPNIVAIYDRGVAEGTYYIAMEYLEGPTLKDVIDERGGLEPNRAIDFATQILAALRFAHNHGVVHRDIKPHNVVVSRDGRLKVTDFGIARAGASQMTEVGSIVGTAQYLSPEQARGEVVGPPSDLYSRRHRAVRDAHGPGAVRGRLRRRDRDEAPRRGARAAERVRPWRTPRARAGRPARARQGRGRPLPDGRGDVGRPRPSASRRRAVAAYGADDACPAATASHRRYAGAASARWHSRVGPRAGPGPAAAAEGASAPRPLAVDPRAPVAAGRRRGRRLSRSRASSVTERPGRPRPTTVAVPSDLVGKDQVTAQNELTRLGLKPAIRGLASSQQPGNVLRVDPSGGSVVKLGSTVTLFVSTGLKLATVPSLKGMTVQQATAALTARGLRYGDETDTNDLATAGTVIKQDPVAGSTAPRGSSVAVTVSSGPKQVGVPDLRGEDLPTAKANLEAGRTAGSGTSTTRRRRASRSTRSSAPTRQRPRSSPQGSAVNLLFSSGIPKVSMPNVVGETADQAAQDIQTAGLVPRTPSPIAVTDPAQDGVVQKTSPSAGTMARAGSSVIIRVGSYTAPTTDTTTTDTTTTTTPPATPPSSP